MNENDVNNVYNIFLFFFPNHKMNNIRNDTNKRKEFLFDLEF